MGICGAVGGNREEPTSRDHTQSGAVNFTAPCAGAPLRLLTDTISVRRTRALRALQMKDDSENAFISPSPTTVTMEKR